MPIVVAFACPSCLVLRFPSRDRITAIHHPLLPTLPLFHLGWSGGVSSYQGFQIWGLSQLVRWEDRLELHNAEKINLDGRSNLHHFHERICDLPTRHLAPIEGNFLCLRNILTKKYIKMAIDVRCIPIAVTKQLQHRLLAGPSAGQTLWNRHPLTRPCELWLKRDIAVIIRMRAPGMEIAVYAW